MKTKNAQEVLKNVEAMIIALENQNGRRYGYRPCYRIASVCDELNIFDWWNENLSKSQLQDMKKFLKEAIKLGYTGYVCFKVGATGCANGMWAYKEESTTGHSPDGETLYKSFTPAYNEWSFKNADGEWTHEIKTIKELEARI